MYVNRSCRCEDCSRANAEYCAAMYQGRKGKERERYQRQKETWTARQRQYRKQNLKAVKAYAQAYKATPRGSAAIRRGWEKRRARREAGFLEHIDPRIVYQMHGGCCGICKEFVAEDEFHVDHVMPLARGGLHGYVNVQPAHPDCNKRKWAHC